MNIQVYPHRIILNKTNEVNSGEYNVNECTFEFSQEYEGLTKVAVFSLCDGTTKNVTILNNQCIIPVECLQETGQVQIGVYGYATQDNELVLRYSPTPQNFVVRLGSYKEGTQPVAPTPTDWEILVEQVSDIAEDVSSIHEDITGINGEISGINIDIRDLQDTKANISDLAEVAFTGEFSDLKNIPSYATTQQLNQEIQDRQDADVNLQSQIDAISVSSDVVDVVGTYQELLNYDTQHLKDNDIVKVLQDSTHSDALSYYRWDKETSTWSYVGSEGPFYTKSETYSKSEVNDLISAITTLDIQVVETLPTQDISTTTIYLVPKSSAGTNDAYDEYIYVSNNWEFIGSTQVDLTDYVKNTDYATASKGGVVKVGANGVSLNNLGILQAGVSSYSDYQSKTNNYFISKGTLENVIIGKDLTTKAYVDSLVGDIGTILDNINGEVIGG